MTEAEIRADERAKTANAARRMAAHQLTIAAGVSPADAECHRYSAQVMQAFGYTIDADACGE